MTTKMEELFVTYANLPLETNPGSLKRIFDIIFSKHSNGFSDKGFFLKNYENEVNKIIDKMAQFAMYEFGKLKPEKDLRADGIQSDTDNKLKMDVNTYVAFRAVHNNKVQRCFEQTLTETKHCFLETLNLMSIKHYANHNFFSWDREKTKCFLCYQKFFRALLKEITKGVDCSEATDPIFMDQFTHSHQIIESLFVYESVYNMKSMRGNNQRRAVQKFINIRLLDFTNPKYTFPFFGFNRRVWCLLFYSLSQFLLNNHWSKLKLCNICGNFFIRKTNRKQIYCSKKCRLKYHNRKRIESGEHREYKREKRREGAKDSYYG